MTGVAGGIERLLLSLKNLKAEKTPEVLVVYIKDFEKAVEIVQELRKNGVSASIDLSKRGLSKQLDYANKLSVRFAVIVGPEELKKGMVRIRDMKSGKEKDVEINKLTTELQKNSFV